MDVPAVETENLTKLFGETRAVDDLSVRVATGAVTGLLGRNGAGKTTLLRILFGLLPPDAGHVRLFGEEAGPSQVRVRDGVAGFVEEPRFYPYLSVRRNLELLSRLDGNRPPAGVGEALERVGLESSGEERAGNLSTGMRQRLGLAGALLRRPRLLLLDEPTIGLDAAAARDVRGLIRGLAGAGVSVFLSSHNLDEVEELCDAVVLVDRGRVVWDGTLERLRDTAPAAEHRLETSDDELALQLGVARPALAVERGDDGRLRVQGGQAERDAYVVALGAAGIAVRLLEPAASPLDALLAALT